MDTGDGADHCAPGFDEDVEVSGGRHPLPESAAGQSTPSCAVWAVFGLAIFEINGCCMIYDTVIK